MEMQELRKRSSQSKMQICEQHRTRCITFTWFICKESYHRSCLLKIKEPIQTDEPWTCKKCLPTPPECEAKIPTSMPKLTDAKNGIKIGHINIRDIKSKNKKDKILILLTCYDFDVLAVTET